MRSILRCRRGSVTHIRTYVRAGRSKNSNYITGRSRATCCGSMRRENPKGTLEFWPHTPRLIPRLMLLRRRGAGMPEDFLPFPPFFLFPSFCLGLFSRFAFVLTLTCRKRVDTGGIECLSEIIRLVARWTANERSIHRA